MENKAGRNQGVCEAGWCLMLPSHRIPRSQEENARPLAVQSILGIHQHKMHFIALPTRNHCCRGVWAVRHFLGEMSVRGYCCGELSYPQPGSDQMRLSTSVEMVLARLLFPPLKSIPAKKPKRQVMCAKQAEHC